MAAWGLLSNASARATMRSRSGAHGGMIAVREKRTISGAMAALAATRDNFVTEITAVTKWQIQPE